jgi:hypothetical protein
MLGNGQKTCQQYPGYRQTTAHNNRKTIGAVFSVGFAPGLYNEDSRQAQWNLESSVAGYSLDKEDLSTGS